MKIVTLDAEFAVNEILELSLFAWDSDSEEEPREILHELFRPRNERRWPGSERVHHISPKMVASKPPFTKFSRKIQTLIDASDCLGGFAIENDIAALEREGIEHLEEKPYLDVRDMHWLLHGREKGVELDARKGLAVTAEELGVDFSDNDAHGASYDTAKTLECLRILWREFMEKYPLSADSEASALEHYQQVWDEAKESFYREFAKGWITLIPATGGFRIKATRRKPEDEDLTTIEVNARHRALNEIDAMFDKRRIKGYADIYDLRAGEIAKFKSYANEYDGEEPTHRKLYQLRVQTHKQLNRL